MARTWVLALALFHPEDVDHIDAFIGADHAVHISWSLPSDSSVVGLTIYRDNLDEFETTIFQIVGLTSSFVDTSADPDDDYRYWIHTRDADGDLSNGVFVEVFEDDDHHHSSWYCSTTILTGVSPWLGVVGAALLLLALKPGR